MCYPFANETFENTLSCLPLLADSSEGIKQQIPEQFGEPVQSDHEGDEFHTFPVLGG